MNKINKIIMLVSAALVTQGCYDNDKIKQIEEKIAKLEKAQEKSAKNGQEKYNNLELNKDGEGEFGEFAEFGDNKKYKITKTENGNTLEFNNFEEDSFEKETNDANKDWFKDKVSEETYNTIKELQNKELTQEQIDNNIKILSELTDEEKKEVLKVINDAQLAEEVVQQIQVKLGAKAEDEPEATAGATTGLFNMPINNVTPIVN